MKYSYKYFPVSDTQRKWGLYATCAGHSKTEPFAAFPSRAHPDEYFFTWEKGRVLGEWQIILLEGGSGTVEFRKRKFAVSQGSLIVLPLGCWHRYRPERKTGWTTSRRFCLRWVSRILRRTYPPRTKRTFPETCPARLSDMALHGHT